MNKIKALLAAVLSYLGYAWLFDYKLAGGITALLILHELGHYAAAKACGIKIGIPVLVPFLGAVIKVEDTEINVVKAAKLALGGPFIGTISAISFAVLYCWLRDLDCLVLAYIGVMLNLFNLIPLEPLDGGQAVLAISPRLWWLGLVIIGIIAIMAGSLFIWLICLFGLVRLWCFDYAEYEQIFFHQLSFSSRLALLGQYLGLVAVLGALIIWLAHLL